MRSRATKILSIEIPFIMSMQIALRMDDIIAKIFNAGLVDANSMKEYTKWACVCKIWHKAHSVFYTKCVDEVLHFKTVCFKTIVENKDIYSAMRGMKRFIWDYNVQVISIEFMTRLILNENGGDMVGITGNQDILSSDGVFGYSIVENVTEDSDAIRALFHISESARVAANQEISAALTEIDEVQDIIYAGIVDAVERAVFFEYDVVNGRIVNGEYCEDKLHERVRNKGVEIIICILETMKTVCGDQDTRRVKVMCIDCLRKLIGRHDYCVEMVCHGALREIMVATESMTEDMDILTGVKMIAAMCDDNDDAQERFLKDNGLLFLIAICRKHKQQKYILHEVCLLIFQLCRRKNMSVADTGVMDFLCYCVVEYNNKERFMYNVFRTLHSLTKSTQNRQRLKEINGDVILAQILAQTEDNVIPRKFIVPVLDRLKYTLYFP